MNPGDLVSVNDRWHVGRLGPGMESWIVPGSVGVIIEPAPLDSHVYGWHVLVDERLTLLNDCYLEPVSQ